MAVLVNVELTVGAHPSQSISFWRRSS